MGTGNRFIKPILTDNTAVRWIKAAMLAHLHKLYPQAKWVVTENAGSNAPMLAINKKLGFKQYRAGTEYQVSRDGLADRLKGLSAGRRS